MTHKTKKVVRRVLTVGTFTGVVAISGCTLFSRPAQPTEPSGFTRAEVQSPASPDAMMEGVQRPVDPRQVMSGDAGDAGHAGRIAQFQAPEINLYGELDGVRRIGTSIPGGQANFQQHTFIDEGYDSAVSIDPTGRYMLFTSTRYYAYPKIYLQRVDGSAVTELTGDGSADAFPVFSPDGKRIAFSSTRAGSWDLYVMDTDGRNVVQVTSGPMQDLHPSFSPDGTRLVYCSIGGRSQQWELWTVNLTSGEKRQIGFGLFPTWSPSKQVDRIAFQRARQRGSRWFGLWTLDLVDGQGMRQTEVVASTNAAVITPAWSPDGHHLVFATVVDPGQDDSARSSGGQQDIWIIRDDGTQRQRLTDGKGTNLMPVWSSDERVYFVSDRSGTDCIWSTPVRTAGAGTVAAKRDSGSSVSATDTGEIGR